MPGCPQSLYETRGMPLFDKPLRVLVVHWDGGGNIAPQRALVRELTRRGHDVHVLTHDSVAQTVSADGATFHHLKTEQQFDAAQPHGSTEERDFYKQHVWSSVDFAEDFLVVHDALCPDICVIDVMLVATLNAAIERGLRFAVLSHLAWMPEGSSMALLGSLVAALPGRTAGSTLLDVLDRAPLVLATSYAEFGVRTPLASHLHFVGPIREPVAPVAWPRRFPDRPFVLVSLSSMFQDQKSTLQTICGALSVLPLEILLTTGRGIAPEELSFGGGVEVRAFVPHDAVLPSAALVVTHAGLGTLMFSAGAGVPTLCLPNGRDQNDNAARNEALGLGRALPADATSAEIASVVTDMVHDEALHATCRSFAARVSRFGDLARAADLVTQAAAVCPAPRT